MDGEQISGESAASVDNRLPQAEIALSGSKKPALAQKTLDRATKQCEAFISLCKRLERVHAAIEAPLRAAEPAAEASQPQPRPRPVAHFEGLAFIADCNDEVLARMGQTIADLEIIFDCST
jgi:hypothetical protein